MVRNVHVLFGSAGGVVLINAGLVDSPPAKTGGAVLVTSPLVAPMATNAQRPLTPKRLR
jgi:hypothetical protein